MNTKNLNNSKIKMNICNSRQKQNNYKCLFGIKKSIKGSSCEADYIWNRSTCACDCDVDCEIGEYL